MKYLVIGANKTTGIEGKFIVDAADEQSAENVVVERNVFVSSVRLLSAASPLADFDDVILINSLGRTPQLRQPATRELLAACESHLLKIHFWVRFWSVLSLIITALWMLIVLWNGGWSPGRH